jgi:hypothetical protein
MAPKTIKKPDGSAGNVINDQTSYAYAAFMKSRLLPSGILMHGCASVIAMLAQRIRAKKQVRP